IVGREFTSQVLRNLVNPGFCDRVREDLRERRSGRGRGDIDNGPAVPGVDHRLAEDLAGEEDALEIDIDDALPFGFADLEEGCAGIDTGGIDENIDVPEASNDLIEGILQAGFAG